MAELLGQAVLEIRTDDRQYLRGLATAQGRALDLDRTLARTGAAATTLGDRLQSLGGHAQDLAGKFFNMRTAAVAAAGAAGLFLFAKRAIEAADEIAKTAKQIGITAEALQELRFVASRAGVDTATFDQSMRLFTQRLGQAQQGVGEAKRAFEQLGITMAELRGKAPDQILALVADRLAAIKSPLQRNALLMDLFSRGGVLMTNMLIEGAAGMEALRRRARELGIVLSNEVTARAEQAADEIDDMTHVLRVAATSAGLELMPAMRLLARALTDPEVLAAIKALSTAIANLTVFFIKWHGVILPVVAGLIAFGAASRLTNAQFAALIAVLAAGAAAWNLNRDGARDLVAELGQVDEATRRLAQGTGEIGDPATDKLTRQLQAQNVGLDQVLARLRDMPHTVRALKDELELENQAAQANIDLSTRQGQAWAEAFRHGQELTRTIAEVETILKDIETPQEAYNQQVERLNQLLAQGAINQDQWNRAMLKAQENLDKATGETKRAEQASKDLGRALDSAFESAIVRGDDLRGVLKGLLQDLSRLLLREATGGAGLGGLLAAGLGSLFSPTTTAANPLGSVTTAGGVVSAGSVFHGGGDVGWTAAPKRRLDPGLFAAAPRLHRGLGPDEFPAILERGERVTPKGGRGGDTFFIDARSADKEGLARLEATIRALNGTIERRAVAAVVDARRRDPSLFGGGGTS